MGIFDKIKAAFNSTVKINDENQDNSKQVFKKVIKEIVEIRVKENEDFYVVRLNTMSIYRDKILLWPDKEKIALLLYCIDEMDRFSKIKNNWNRPDKKDNYVQEAFILQLLRAKLHLDEQDIENLAIAFIYKKKYQWSGMTEWPIGLLLNQLSKQYKDVPLTEKIRATLEKMKLELSRVTDHGSENEKVKLLSKIDQLLFAGAENEVKKELFMGEDGFRDRANEDIKALKGEEQQHWYRILAKSKKASGGQPTKKYLDEALVLTKALGTDKFKKVAVSWFDFTSSLKEVTTEHSYGHGNQAYTYSTSEFLSSVNQDALKGLVWMCGNFHDQTTLQALAKLAERCFRKIPGKGPAAAGLGNACLYALYKSKGLDGIGHLSRLKLRIKQSSTQGLIEKYIGQAAVAQGVSTHDIEDMAVEDFKLEHGERHYNFDEYRCKISITGVGKSELAWFKPDGSPQKTVPAFVKEKYGAKLKKLKDTQKQIDQTTSAQRDRIDRMFRTGRTWSYESFKTLYMDHGLLSILAEKIIWYFTNQKDVKHSFAVIWLDGNWQDNQGETVLPEADTVVSLWHPALESLSETATWRALLSDKKIQQPLKQAFREVYLLTDAEINTKSYSNRMASHILKQHQFNMLAKIRGWKYALMGAYDDGRYNEAAEVQLPEYNLKAQYWINEVNADGAYNDTGIWNYIATDQIRFVSTLTNETIDLIDVPILPFSEILRDVDLFVGVASVGNDPTWQDSGGIPAYRDYWTSFSFGDLSEVAKNRKEILEGLVPRLKISKVATIKDRFLIVKGKLRTYKIHLGSTNILMEPNDQYLCIVPDRSQKNPTENLFIPFEGDTGLSVILSKAFLLAEDDKITDTTITSQINRK